MARPTKLVIEPSALLHNVKQIRHYAPGKKIIAMVKANAYGCGVHVVAPVLDGQVDGFGVACMEEALAIRAMGVHTPCVLFQGIFSADELPLVAKNQFSLVLHTHQQLRWIINSPLKAPIKIWVKVDTGMHRLGFKIQDLQGVMDALQSCPWVNKDLGLMTHFACADEPERLENSQQMALFQAIDVPGFTQRSMANSAAIISLPHTQEDAVRPGIMLYGVSPFANKTARDLGLIPAMRFMSAISAIHHNPPFTKVGYGGTWSSSGACVIGIVAAGYGDGYPRHIAANTPVSIGGRDVPIVGRVSMDMMAVDLTDHPGVEIGCPVELWGEQVLVEQIARAAGTVSYELMCQISERVRYGASLKQRLKHRSVEKTI
ncbi:MAG: alanine racemase [Legionellales bacterium]